MNKIIFITSQDLSEWNFKRFGLDILSKNFKIEYWNVAKLHSKKSLEEKNDSFSKYLDVISFNNYFELIKICFKQNRNNFLIDLSSNRDFFFIISKNIMILKGIKELSISTGAFAEKKKKLKNKLSTFLNKLKYKNYLNFFIRNLLVMFKKYFILKKYNHYFINGSLNDLNIDREKKTFIHSIDYNLYLDLKKKNNDIKNKYITYLDQKLIGHPEFDFLSTPNFYDKNFYEYLEIFLKKVEQFYNRDVIFCAHPRAKKDDVYLKNFKNVEFNKSAYYSMNSDLIIAHDSVSLNFPILFKKPILLVKVPGMELTDKIYNLELTSEILDCGIIDINDFNFDENLITKKINDYKYNDYIKKYIKYSGEEKNSWEIISKKLLEIK